MTSHSQHHSSYFISTDSSGRLTYVQMAQCQNQSCLLKWMSLKAATQRYKKCLYLRFGQNHSRQLDFSWPVPLTQSRIDKRKKLDVTWSWITTAVPLLVLEMGKFRLVSTNFSSHYVRRSITRLLCFSFINMDIQRVNRLLNICLQCINCRKSHENWLNFRDRNESRAWRNEMDTLAHETHPNLPSFSSHPYK